MSCQFLLGNCYPIRKDSLCKTNIGNTYVLTLHGGDLNMTIILSFSSNMSSNSLQITSYGEHARTYIHPPDFHCIPFVLG